MRMRLCVVIAEITVSIAVVVTLVPLISQMNAEFMRDFREYYDLSIEEAGIWNRWLFFLWKGLGAQFLSTGLIEAPASK